MSEAPRQVAERIEEALREIGVLLIAFAPLDVALKEGPRNLTVLLSFLSLGAGLFGIALWLERRRDRA